MYEIDINSCPHHTYIIMAQKENKQISIANDMNAMEKNTALEADTEGGI